MICSAGSRPGIKGVLTSVEVARRLVDAINAHDVEAIVALLTEDHRFVDSVGHVVEGRTLMRSAWSVYLAMVPEYAVRVTETFVAGDVVALFGVASGAYAVNGCAVPDSRWHTPAAWRAVVRDDRVAEWRVYADNEPLRDVMRRAR